MSLLRPSKDARRKSPRKTAGEMPQYLAKEYKENKGVQGGKKSGGDGKKRAREIGEKWDQRRSLSSFRQACPCWTNTAIQVL
jgi:hypothetical protein